MATAGSQSSLHQNHVQRGVATDSDADNDTDAGLESDSEDSVESESDSVIYQVEPFVTYQDRIRTLAREVLWKDVSDEDLVVERLGNGSYNRVIGIARQGNGVTGKMEYVVRIPWNHEKDDLEKDIAPLLFVKEKTQIPSPDVIVYDSTPDNVLESPYVIQSRVPGVNAHSIIMKNDEAHKITHDGWCKLAYDLGRVVNQMLSVHNNKPGQLVLDSSDSRNILIAPLQTTVGDSPEACRLDSSSQPEDTACSLLPRLCYYQRALDLEKDPEDTYDQMELLARMATDMGETGHLDNIPHTFCHLDFFLRNMIISVNPFTHEPKIEGILDWDSALFAPAFMVCEPPAYLWNSTMRGEAEDEDQDYEDWHIDITFDPITEEDKKVKRIFEEAAGEEYVRFAYDPVYRLARRLFQFGIKGIHGNVAHDESEKLLEYWRTLNDAPKEVASRFPESMESVDMEPTHQQSDHPTMETASDAETGLKRWLRGVKEKLRRLSTM
ncbi:hypothetical protein QBC41DRAFT_384136 [Cercophora samala]|uniref:Aminoglycoside phosphotransferase domain-containing protein n=1 Tax=Cercophora samala TaxID=330535 RepID=A0AA39YXU0_9PEZI|nr:hypothetical protein QBC41DRAFT_384136 [Cercophora samala]